MKAARAYHEEGALGTMATLADVAERAGVSVSTAGRVLSKQGYTGREARARVLGAAEAVGYVPNRLARSLRTRRSQLIGLLIGDVENVFYSSIASTLESAVMAHGYHILLCNSSDDADQEREYLKLLDSTRVDGIILTPTGENHADLANLIDKGMAVVQIDRRVRGLKTDAVVFDNQRGATNGVTHLIESGHTRIGILTGQPEISTARLRLAGYRNALSKHGIAVPPEYVKATSFRHDRAVEVAGELLATDPPPTAVFATNNILAEAVLIAARAARMSVPDDLSIVGFGDYPWMRLVTPQITTLGSPITDMSRRAAKLMLRRLTDGPPPTPRTYTCPTELILRESVRRI